MLLVSLKSEGPDFTRKGHTYLSDRVLKENVFGELRRTVQHATCKVQPATALLINQHLSLGNIISLQ